MHTTATDGKATLEEMVAAAQARGLEYIAITDHSKRVTMANGLDAERLRSTVEGDRQAQRELARLQSAQGRRGRHPGKGRAGSRRTTCWPRPTGSWPASTTARTNRASRSPSAWSTRWPIPTSRRSPIRPGRLHQSPQAVRDRPGGGVRRGQGDHGKMLELNANPPPARPGRRGLRGGQAARHSDRDLQRRAQSTEGLDVLRYGVLQARRAGLTKRDVVNTRDLKKLQELIAKGRAS